jgi:hypothetical protein
MWLPTRFRKLSESESMLDFLWQAMFSSRSLNLIHRTSACRSTFVVHSCFAARAAFSTSFVAQHNTAADSKAAQNVQRTPATTSLKADAGKKRTGTKEIAPAGTAERLEEQLTQLDTLHAMEGELNFDVWAQPLNTFGKLGEKAFLPSDLLASDLHIPSWRSPRADATLWDHVKAFWATQLNGMRNVVSYVPSFSFLLPAYLASLVCTGWQRYRASLESKSSGHCLHSYLKCRQHLGLHPSSTMYRISISNSTKLSPRKFFSEQAVLYLLFVQWRYEDCEKVYC